MSVIVRFQRKPVGDTTVPTVAMSNPASGATISATTVIQGTSGDNVAVARVEIAIDGGPFLPASGISPWSYQLDTTALTNGPHVIHARSVDTSGNLSLVVDRNITVNNVTQATLQVAFVTPVQGDTITGERTLRGTMSSTGAAVTKVEVSVDGGGFRVARILNGKWYITLNTATLQPGLHTLTARVTDANNKTASSSVTVTVTATTILPGAHLIKLNDTAYNNVTHKDQYSLLIVGQPTGGGQGVAGGASLQPGRCLLWSHATNTGQAEGDGMGIAGSVITANNWWLHNSAGAILPYGDGFSYMTNIGNPDYQQAVINHFLNVVFPRFPNAEGVLQDNIFDFHWAGYSREYPDHASYRAAMLSFVKVFGKAMQEAGYYYAGNILAADQALESGQGLRIWDGTQWIWWMKQLAPYMHGMAQEFYMRQDFSKPVRTIGTTAQQGWQVWSTATRECEAVGCDHIGWMPLGNMTQTAEMTYGFACMLLDTDTRGGSAFNPVDWSSAGGYSSPSDTYNAIYVRDIGVPEGAKTNPATGWYRRTFINLSAVRTLVLVNANPSGANFVSDGHTVPPASAYIGAP